MVHVIPETFCNVANTTYSAAGRVWSNYKTLVDVVADCTEMSGSDETGKEWGDMFQSNLRNLAQTSESIVMAMSNYGGVLYQLGQNHAQAETANGGGPVNLPPEQSATATSCFMLADCTGGSGEGMQTFVDLANEIGIPIPDGDTGKLSKMHDALLEFAKFDQGQSSWNLADASQQLDSLSSPEIDVVVEDLEELQSVIDNLKETAQKMAESCNDHKTWLDETRDKMIEQIKELGKELAVDLAEGIALSFITVGIGGLVKAAHTATKIKKYGKIIRGLLDAAKGAKALGKATYLKDVGRFTRWGKQIERFKFLRRVDASDAEVWAKNARIKGRVGEDAAGINPGVPKEKVTINGRPRVPDRMDADLRELEEVKNVKNLSYTQQLRDMKAIADQRGYKFILTVDNNTVLNGPLQQAVNNGEIVLRRIDMSR